MQPEQCRLHSGSVTKGRQGNRGSIVVPFPVATRHFSPKCYNRCTCVTGKCRFGQVSMNLKTSGQW